MELECQIDINNFIMLMITHNVTREIKPCPKSTIKIKSKVK